MFKMPTMGLDNSHVQKKTEAVPSQYKASTPVFGLGQVAGSTPALRPEPKPVVEKANNTEKKSKPEKKVKPAKPQAEAATTSTEAPEAQGSTEEKPKKEKKPVDPNRRPLKDVITQIVTESSGPISAEDIYKLVRKELVTPILSVRNTLSKMDNVEALEGEPALYRLKQ